MVSTIANEAGSALAPRESVANGSDYALNRKADWDRNDFSSLFERHLLGGYGKAPNGSDAPSIPFTAAGEAAVPRDLEQPDSDIASWSGAVPDGAIRATSISSGQDYGVTAGPLESTGVGLAETAPTDQWTLNDFPSQENAVSPSMTRVMGQSDAAATTPRVTTRLDGDAVDIWIRDSDTTDTNAPALLRDIRAQLSWRGLTLASLTINGRSVTSPNGRYTALDSTNSVSREQEHGR